MVTYYFKFLLFLLFYSRFKVNIFNKDSRSNLSYFGCDGVIFNSHEQDQTKHGNSENTEKEERMSRILGGISGQLHGHAVRISLLGDFRKPLCTGTIQNALYIITVAHCVVGIEPSKLIVTAGAFTRFQEQNLSVVSYDIHDGWDPQTFANDVALLKLNDSYVLSKNQVEPVELGQPDLVNGNVQISYITGYGLMKFPRNLSYALRAEIASVPLIDNNTCKEIYLKLGKTVLKNQICAGGKIGEGPCTGDDGSPLTVNVLYINKAYRLFVVGILSSYQGCGSGVPDIYTELENYKEWIESKAGYSLFIQILFLGHIHSFSIFSSF